MGGGGRGRSRPKKKTIYKQEDRRRKQKERDLKRKKKKKKKYRWEEREREIGGRGVYRRRGETDRERQTPSTGLQPPPSSHCHNRPIRKVSCSPETLAGSHGDHVSPSTRPREFEISIKSIASSLCPRRPCLRTHRKYQTQLAL